ncbi:MAG: cytosine permease [Thermaerobacter sp.]|nr:cytosine permease [Thermaerobacter sp.]
MSESIASLETMGIEPISPDKRRGAPRQQFTLWWSANLGMPPFLVGVLGPVLGLSLLQTVWAVVLGNIIASLLLGITAAVGIGYGLAQMPLSRALFGHKGNYFPAALNALSSLGWYVVNTAVGGTALAVLLHVNVAIAFIIMIIAQGAIVYLGHDMIHRFEHWMAYVQGALFIGLTISALMEWGAIKATAGGNYGSFLILLAAVASYSFSWSTYASDYTRYLPTHTSRRRVFWLTFWGSWLSCVWVEVAGGIAGALGLGNLSAVGIVQHLMGRFSAFAELAIVFGTMTANALNSYTSTMSLLTLDLPFLRPYAGAAIAVIGGLIAWFSSSHLLTFYSNFLLLISYWIAPWIGITFVGAWMHQLSTQSAMTAPPVRWASVFAFVVGMLVIIPFMDTTLFEGPIAKALQGGDISYYLGLIVAALIFWAIERRTGGTMAIGRVEES